MAHDIAEKIDHQIYANYKLWPNNYIAYDMLMQEHQFKSKYTHWEERKFKIMVEQAMVNIDYPITDIQERFLKLYANPVINKLKTTSMGIGGFLKNLFGGAKENAADTTENYAENAIEKVKKVLDNKTSEQAVHADYFFVKDKGALKKIATDDILYFEAMGDYVKVFVGEKNYMVHNTLKNIELKFSVANKSNYIF